MSTYWEIQVNSVFYQYVLVYHMCMNPGVRWGIANYTFGLLPLGTP